MRKAWLENLKGLEGRLGSEILIGLSQCLIHADRLTTLADLVLLSVDAHGVDSSAHARNLRTVFWMACGTMWEASSAVEALRGTGIEGFCGADGTAWSELNRILNAWRAEPLLVRARSNVAFHVDENGKLLRRGIDALIASGKPVLIASIDREDSTGGVSATLGDEILMAGLKIEEADFRSFAESVAATHVPFSSACYRLLQDLIEAGKGYIRIDD